MNSRQGENTERKVPSLTPRKKVDETPAVSAASLFFIIRDLPSGMIEQELETFLMLGALGNRLLQGPDDESQA